MSGEDVSVPGHFADLVLDLLSACLSGRDKTGLNWTGLWLKTPRDTQSAFCSSSCLDGSDTGVSCVGAPPCCLAISRARCHHLSQ